MVEQLRPDIVLATPPPISHRTAEENLGLGYLVAVLRREKYEVGIVDGWLSDLTPHQVAEEILKSPPRLFLGFSCYRSNMERTMEVASLLKQVGLEVPLIVGGFGPTFNPEEFLHAGFDIVVRGEGEETVLEISKHFLTGIPNLSRIRGISYAQGGKIIHNTARPLVKDLDSLPFPERDTMYLAVKRKTPVHILTARGCQAHCVFCSIVAFQRLSEGAQWRQRSIRNFVDELSELASKGVRHFKVIDDSLIEPPRDENWCKELADEIQKRGLQLRLRGLIRADRVTDGVIKELKRAGFFAFSCGIENGSQSALKRMGKSATLEQNIQALEIFQKYGMYIQAGHILFDHGTTIEELEENYWFMRKYIWTISKGVFTEMYAAEGTPFTNFLAKKGLLQKDQRVLGNNTYPVLDESATRVYFGLKEWHKSHMKIYDMTIDAISAPKALEPTELKLFEPLCLRLRERDLGFMRSILDLVESGMSQEEVLTFTKSEIERTKGWYESFVKEVRRAYEATSLVYDAHENPFIC